MKKIIAIFSILVFANFVQAQVVRIPAAKPKTENKFDNSWKLLSTGTGFNSSIKITMSVKYDETKGQYLSFICNTSDMVAEIVLLNSPQFPPNYDDVKTFNIPNGLIAHNLYLQLGDYNLATGQRNGYLIYFHTKNSDKPVWICTYSPIK